LKCSVCGDVIENDSKYCAGCGSLVSLGSVREVENVVKKKEMTSNKATPLIIKNKKENQKFELNKILSSTKLFYFIFFLFLAGSIIIYSSGLFDKTINVDTQQNEGANNPHAGVDMNNLAEINSLEETILKNSSDEKSLLQLAHLLNDSGFKAKAIDRYNQYLKIKPDNADVLVDMGVCYYETGKNKEAITSMEKAIKIQPNHQIAHLNLGIVNMAAGNSLKAVEYWKKAVELNPTNEIGKRAQELIKQH
jgi:tetratricopeptide (TPR) repeat protein